MHSDGNAGMQQCKNALWPGTGNQRGVARVGVDLDDPVVSRLDLVDPAREVVFDVVQIDEAVAEVDGIARRHVLEVVFLGASAAVEHVEVLEAVHVPVPREPPRRQRPVVLRHHDEGDLGARLVAVSCMDGYHDGVVRSVEQFGYEVRFADGDEGFVSLKQAHEAAARALEKKRSAESSSSKPAAKKRK